jgi:lipoate-protein ligase B
VFTLGRRADETNVVFSEDERATRGIQVVHVDRGGDVTYHGPGQLVGYPIFKLAGPRVVDHVRALEEINLRVLASYGIHGERVDGYTGVWVGKVKVTAIGVRVTADYVTQHGWATNVSTDLGDFDGIVPCGIADPDRDVASLRTLGVDATMDEVKRRTQEAVAAVFGVTLEGATVDDLDLGPLPAAT